MLKGIIILVVAVVIMVFFKSRTQLTEEGLPVVPVSKLYDEAAVAIYEGFFCDNIELYKEGMKDIFPVLFSENPSKEELLKLANDESVESRIRILAYRRLKEMKVFPDTKEVLGVIVEYNQRKNHGKGLDAFAVYPDGNIRYINYTGKMAFVSGDTPISQFEQPIKEIFEQAHQLAQVIGPWEKKRLPPPAPGNVRVTLLVNGDIYLGQGPDKVMFNDKLGAPLLHNMSMLLQQITQLASEQEPNA